MRVKIQRTDDSITLQECSPEESCKNLVQDLREVNGDFYDLAMRFFECFPRFREIVFNTDLTDER